MGSYGLLKILKKVCIPYCMLGLYLKIQKQTKKSSAFVSAKENSQNFEISENLRFKKYQTNAKIKFQKFLNAHKQKVSEFPKIPKKLTNTELLKIQDSGRKLSADFN